ncbi:murein transglycosylase [Echinicola pacifica]|uniref:Murein transglycosylase n=1 Tax=Echinicola pacifica TaxID=346377 RepID=A0A918PSG3_9BACT|nr:lytic transglycosylase domain-containing protein [Echinicola pacifica]GGZ19726.1 murein transglycosylase [Echinicola pacifica]
MKHLHIFILYGLVAVLFILWYRSTESSPQPVATTQESPVFIPSEEPNEEPIEEPNSSIIRQAAGGHRVELFDLPKTMDFAGEKVPLEAGEIQERLEREVYVNAFWESNMLLMMKRAGRYLPEIEKILAQYKIPNDFKYVAIIESGLMNVVSPADARGFWQFMSGTAKDFGLEVNKEVDERYDYIQATHAACKYLKQSYAKFGKWTNVAASYNIGQTGLIRRMNDQQQPDYYDLALNEETARYMFRILAFKEIMENPEKYGFHLQEKDLYKMPQLKTLVVKSTIDDLADWAIKHGSNYKDLKTYNPWLRSSKLTISKNNEYHIKLPV